MLSRAYAANPLSREAAALYEGALVDAGRSRSSRKGAARSARRSRRSRGARAHGAHVRNALGHASPETSEVGARFLEEALKLDPTQDGAFFFLREAYGKKGGDWDRVLTLAEEAMTHSTENGDATFLLAQAGDDRVARAGKSDSRANGVRAARARSHPEHPQLRAFEAQIGETLAARAARATHDESAPSGVPDAARSGRRSRSTRSRAGRNRAGAVGAPRSKSKLRTVAACAPHRPAAARPPRRRRRRSPSSARSPRSKKRAKRYNEYVKTLLQLAALVPDAHEKVELYMKAAELYVGKFANQAEAVKAYEAVVAIDPENATAIDYLRQMYEKRRDWEKLLGLQRREAERLPRGPERAQKFLEIAKLATERVKKPEVCIELWNEVIASDDANAEALAALSVLYERSKEFDKLASVLEKQAEITYDSAQKIQILNKLGTIYGDRLNNDEGAVGAWRTLLTLDPNDRKAQEALKKKYLALGRWDDLEVFYAETGKWDEFIRVLEQQEAKETKPDAKIGMLFKIAELWADKKQKARSRGEGLREGPRARARTTSARPRRSSRSTRRRATRSSSPTRSR